MTEKELKISIQKSIIEFSEKPLHEAAINLFKALGYNTDRQNPFTQKTFEYFRKAFIQSDSRFNEEKALIKQWKSVDLLFQLTPSEVSNQEALFDTKQIDNTIIESYLFFALELLEKEYTRTQLAQISREINKIFPMPVLIVFKHDKSITLSVINRRLNRKDAQKDVLEKVTVIKDISIEAPHRAHIEILHDLSFDELQRVQKFTNFVELHNAWQKTLDTKELNKRFYHDLSNWYFWALQEVHFPTVNWSADKSSLMNEADRVKEHNAKNLIRLLTRLLFVWFVKEKNLIPDELFDEKYIKTELLNNFEPAKKKGFDHKTQGSKYYRAILQNLFFATLNQTVGKREFRKDGQQMNVTNLMRYESYFKEPKAFIKLVEDIVPFMNGGLFECLDSPDPILKGKKGGDVIIYEDGFSDRKDNTLCVPDYIFFGINEHADLSEELGDKRQKDVTVNGLINILKSYKFTVTENTPIEEDVALDPELLGRVFENLLASYNPETKTTARKQTGSFYTPREIVNYMVDESLKAYLKQKLEIEAEMSPEDAENNVAFIVGYNEKKNLFDEKQTNVLIKAIDDCKILDPACGSGAFPMGILHKMVHILHKLDPDNKLWKERQIEKAQSIDDAKIREKLIEDIETAFENNELDYGRKLYLIENCIYGVDIQPIATQISKLRFFISLIVDQKTDKSKENFGIRPLPNLETKFVAANTLIGIEKPDGFLRDKELDEMEEKLKDVRHRLFSAKTPSTKRKLREEDQQLREEMGKILQVAGWSNESARQLASWDPYNQNVSSDWFDSEWMFGVVNGFDIVIGNPPYESAVTMARSKEEKKYFKKYYPEATGSYDIYVLFLLKTLNLLNRQGYYSWIIPNKFLIAEYSCKTRDKLINNGIITSIDVSVFDVFENTSVYPIIIIGCCECKAEFKEYLLEKYSDLEIGRFTEPKELNIYTSFSDAGIEFCSGATGFEAENLRTLLTVRNTNNSIPFVVSGCIDRYYYNNKNVRFMGLKLDFAYIKKSDSIANSKWQLWSNEKIIIAGMTKVIEATYVKSPLALGVGVYAIHFYNNFDPYFLTAILNSKFLTYYINIKFKHKHLAGGYLALNKSTLEKLPFVKPTHEQEQLISKLAQEIICLKENPNADTVKLEKQIDEQVYELYKLTKEEVTIIEDSFEKKLKCEAVSIIKIKESGGEEERK